MPKTVVLNPDILEMEYAVRGPIPQRAAEMRREGRSIISCHIGNPQALGQSPLQYYRQVLSLVEDPERIRRERSLPGGIGGVERIQEQVLDLAESILSQLQTGMGAYTESNGPRFIREAVARYIDRRDDVQGTGGVASDPDSIFLTNGASEGVRFLLEMLIARRTDGILIPTPQYPLYSATIRKCGGSQVSYFPDEDADWALDRSMLDDALARAKGEGIDLKAIVVINPGNPTGAILDRRSIEEVIGFAAEHGLIILADEVYQENLYGGTFVSFARALGKRRLPLMSMHSTSKGFYGECGHRGGYLEVRNAPAVQGSDVDFTAVLFKQASVSLCSNTVGQILTYLLASPPAEGSEAYPLFAEQRRKVLQDLQDKGAMIRKAFDSMEGMRCFGRTGAMYLFPRLEKLPAGATDFDYCLALLEKTGWCTVNGSGFGQKEGTSHLRVAFLPPKDVLEAALPRWVEFHNGYVSG